MNPYDPIYNSVICKGLTDIPYGQYELEALVGETKNGARRAVYRNTGTGDLFVVFNIDAHAELWSYDQSEILTSLSFGWIKNSGKIIR